MASQSKSGRGIVVVNISKKKCSVTKTNGSICQREATVLTEEKGLICRRHYSIFRSNDSIEKIERICEANNCSKPITNKGFCDKHAYQMQKYGKIRKRTNRDPNELTVINNVVEMVLYNRIGAPVAKVIFDISALEKVRKYKWSLTDGYVCTRVKRKFLKLHHLLIGKPPRGMVADHINRNRLDNREENLRFVTYTKNVINSSRSIRNSSGKTGVCWNKRIAKWQSQIQIHGTLIYLGVYRDLQDAITMRKEAEKQYFGEYSPA